MPLLKRQPFVRQKLPEDVDLEEELFYCKVTREVFRDYEEFFERVILCNSLVWTCELTSRPGLTYVEALESEARARRCLESFPQYLKRPILYLASLTKRGRLADMCDDVYSFAKDRFFIGEELEVTQDGEKVKGVVTKVIAPEMSKRHKENGITKQHQSGVQTDEENEKKTFGPNPSLYHYDVKLNEDSVTVSPPAITRKKGIFTRDKNKLFLKQFFEPRENIWKLKEAFNKKYHISSMKFTDISAGEMPTFVTTFSKKLSPFSTGKSLETTGAKAKARLKASKETETSNKTKKALPVKEITVEDVEELRRNLDKRRQEREQEKLKQKLEKEKERERIREEKRLQAEYMKEWHKPREDLECDDLQVIPLPIAVQCSIPNELFGKALMILEFVNAFGYLFGLRDIFSQGFTLELLERSILENDIQSPFGDIMQFLIQAIFSLQAGEETVMTSTSLDQSDIADDEADESTDVSLIQLLKTAAAMKGWSQRHLGLPLKKLTVDSFTITEIIRLHLLTLGGQTMHSAWHQQIKGIYSVWDDPAVELCLGDPELLKAIATKSIYSLNPAEKLKLMEVLIHQLLTFLAVREKIEETLEKVRASRIEMKHLQWAEQRREKEEVAAWKSKLLNDASDPPENGILDTVACDSENGSQTETNGINTKMKQKFNAQFQRKRESFLRKEQDILDTINKMQSGAGVQPLGRDRAYRRFWVFNSIPGLFVEDDDSFLGHCLPQPTPTNCLPHPYLSSSQSSLSSNGASETNIKVEKKSEKILMNNKENKVSEKQLSKEHVTVCNKKHKLLSDNHPTVMSGKLTNVNHPVKEDLILEMVPSEKPQGFLCTANIDKCPVHSRASLENRTHWSFYCTSETFDELVSSLNPRGYREGPLREILLQEKQHILRDINKCPVHRLNPEVASSLELQEIRKSTRLTPSSGSGKVSSIPAEEALELALREMILDVEERLYAGSLGWMNVSDRICWREAIQQRSYVSGCEELIWGKHKEKKLSQGSDNERSTPVSEQEILSQRSSSPVDVSQTAKDLASAVLQIAQGIEPKYVKRPLGENDDERKQRLKLMEDLEKKMKRNKEEDIPDTETDKKLLLKYQQFNPLMERWEESLMASINFSQIFLHLSALELSIAWSRSALNARCRVCHRRGDAENMLLCDECNRGHHTYCLKPPLKTIPKDDWFCKDCKPREELKPSSKVISAMAIQSDATEEEEEESASENSLYSFDEASGGEEIERDEEPIINDDLCDTCQRGGHLICCDNCPLSFHMECTNPPLKRIPRGRWACENCTFSPTRHSLRKRPAEVDLNESPAKRTRSRDKTVPEEDEEIWMSGHKRQGPPNRRGARDVPVDYKLCDEILVELSRHECSWPFTRPVKNKEAPHYYEIIKRPADLATMRKKLSNMEYRTTRDFLVDVLLLTQNCMMYNAVDSAEFIAARGLIEFFENLVHQLGYFNFEKLLFHVSQSDSNSASSSSSPQGKFSSR